MVKVNILILAIKMSMMVIGLKIKNMGLVNLQTLKQMSGTRVSGNKTKSMEMVKSSIKMVKTLRADGKAVFLSTKKLLMTHKAISFMVSQIIKAESMAKENAYIRILEMYMKENGTKIKNTEQESLLILLNKKIKITMQNLEKKFSMVSG